VVSSRVAADTLRSLTAKTGLNSSKLQTPHNELLAQLSHGILALCGHNTQVCLEAEMVPGWHLRYKNCKTLGSIQIDHVEKESTTLMQHNMQHHFANNKDKCHLFKCWILYICNTLSIVWCVTQAILAEWMSYDKTACKGITLQAPSALNRSRSGVSTWEQLSSCRLRCITVLNYDNWTTASKKLLPVSRVATDVTYNILEVDNWHIILPIDWLLIPYLLTAKICLHSTAIGANLQRVG